MKQLNKLLKNIIVLVGLAFVGIAGWNFYKAYSKLDRAADAAGAAITETIDTASEGVAAATDGVKSIWQKGKVFWEEQKALDTPEMPEEPEVKTD